MRELYVGQRTEEDEDGQKYCFDYYILVDQMCVSDGFACEARRKDCGCGWKWGNRSPISP